MCSLYHGDYLIEVLQLFDARLQTCQSALQGGNDIWELLALLVDTLGYDGNSSDETDGQQHVIRIKEWRSVEIRTLLDFIDKNRTMTNAYGNRLLGTQPHLRIHRSYGPLSTHSAVAALPRNFYDNAWYDSLTAAARENLAAREFMELPMIDI